jgi:hypothetical protein
VDVAASTGRPRPEASWRRLTAATSAIGLALDGGAVYFTSRDGGGSLRRAPKADPSSETVLATGLADTR